MSIERRAIELIDLLCEASVRGGPAWQRFADRLASELGDPILSISIQVPGVEEAFENEYIRVGMSDESVAIFGELYKEGMPWVHSVRLDDLRDRFVRVSDIYDDDDLASTRVYLEWMKPLDLACEGPLIHIMSGREGLLASGITIYRRAGGRPFSADDLAVLDLLVPHLQRAVEMRSRIGREQTRTIALNEVIDRMPTGVILIDSERQPVLTNRIGRNLADAGDGFRLGRDGPTATDPKDNANLKQLLESAIEPPMGETLNGGGFMAIHRPSGSRPYPVMISPLLQTGPNAVPGEAVAILFISDPEFRRITTIDLLKTLYGLTNAESELVQLLSRGHPLEAAANIRGVTMNTARSQLKQVFAKTDTSRQGELLQLVLTGVASLSDS